MQREIAIKVFPLDRIGVLLNQESNHFEGLVERTCIMQREITPLISLLDRRGVLLDQETYHFQRLFSLAGQMQRETAIAVLFFLTASGCCWTKNSITSTTCSFPHA